MQTDPVTIRRAALPDAGSIAAVHVASWRATYSGIIAQSYLDALSVEERALLWERRLSNTSPSRAEILVAETRAGIVGFVAGRPLREPTNGYHAQLQAIYVLAGAQGTGIGRKLTQAWATAMIGRGAVSAVVEVLADNPARKFYERLGARHLEDIDVVIGAVTYTEARYGWVDLRALRP